MLLRPILGSVRAQATMTRRSIEDLLPIIISPLPALIFMAILVHAGRKDLAAYSLVAPMLMSVGSMAFFVASELMTREKSNETLELMVACPTPFSLVMFSRITVLTSLSLLGIVESWLIIRVVFGVSVSIHHPWTFTATMLMTAFASAGTALITAALFCFARTARTFQNSIMYPLYLLAGILVPVSVFPGWLQPLSRLIFLYWSANLLRDSMQATMPDLVLLRLGAITILGIGGALVGGALMHRMLNLLKRDGRLGLQ